MKGISAQRQKRNASRVALRAEEDDERELDEESITSSLRTDDASGLGVDESIEFVGLDCAPLPSRSFFVSSTELRPIEVTGVGRRLGLEVADASLASSLILSMVMGAAVDLNVGPKVGASVGPIVGGSDVGAAVPLPLNPHSRQVLNVNEIDLLASGALTFRM